MEIDIIEIPRRENRKKPHNKKVTKTSVGCVSWCHCIGKVTHPSRLENECSEVYK